MKKKCFCWEEIFFLKIKKVKKCEISEEKIQICDVKWRNEQIWINFLKKLDRWLVNFHAECQILAWSVDIQLGLWIYNLICGFAA